MYERILVCLDGSDLAEQVLPLAEALALGFRSDIILLRVIDISSVVWDYNCPTVDQARKHAKKVATIYLEKIAEAMRTKGLKVDIIVISKADHVGETIICHAHENNIGVIALATHGRGGLGRVILGSVAEHVLKKSKLPLLVIRPQPD